MATAYHHGDLREALLRAALAMVEAEGPQALSLRGVARAAGVSAMAPYHHFKDRAALVAAVAAAGHDRLYTDKLKALASAPADPIERLVAGAVSYVRFVLANPQLYRLMASPELAGRHHPDLARSAAAPVASLAELVAAARAAGRLTGGSPAAIARQLWALCHGLGQMGIDGHAPGEDMVALAETGARALLTGYS